jgi:hypothetical protein
VLPVAAASFVISNRMQRCRATTGRGQVDAERDQGRAQDAF